MQTLNETPIRTCRNFNINNIKLEDIKFPEVINKFNNIEITGDTSLISNNTSDINLTYGVGELLINEIKEHQNANMIVQCMGLSRTSAIEEIEVNFNFDEDNPTLIENLEIIANENSKSTIILKYQSQKDIQFFHNGLIKVNAK